MHKNTAVSLQNISKVYKLYDKPIDRLKESLHPFKKKYHKDFYALKNINLEIKKGEVLGIVGVNGAGKSTLLKIISGVLTPTSGRVNIHGRVNAILELGSSLKPEMTGRENIKLNLQINGIEKDTDKLIHEIIEFADIGEHIDQPVKSYSSGMKARLGFGIATSTDPDVLIVDEVLAVGDVLFQRKCYSRIEKLFKDGKTVIFVSHSAQSVVEFCSRAILLYDREIIMDDTPKKITDYYQKLVFSNDKQKVLDEIDGKKYIGKTDLKEEMESVSTYNQSLSDISTIEIVNKNIFDIKECNIYDNNNKNVNVLKIKKNYFIRLKLKVKDEQIKKDMDSLLFGITFINKEGIRLAGKELRVKETKEGFLELEANFDCIFNKNIYSLSFACKGKTYTSDYILYISDLILFEVEEYSDIRWGLVQL